MTTHSTNEITLHRGTEEDWESHRDLRLEMLRDTPDAFWSTLEENEGYGEAEWRAATRGGHFLQARRGGEVLGGLGLLTEGSVDFPLPQDAAALVAVYVAPRARGLGVGDRLVEAAKDLARELGRRRIVLEVGSFNEHAIALYQRHGFRFTGATVPHPRREDVVEREMVWEDPDA